MLALVQRTDDRTRTEGSQGNGRTRTMSPMKV